MKVQAIIVLLAIMFSVLAPPSVPFLAMHGSEQAIGNLDVCHSGTPAISHGGEMPFLNECLGSLVPSSVFSAAPDITPLFIQALFTIRNERPPIA